MEFNQNELIKSPMNYVGGKYKLLPQILPLFPNNINTFVDMFCGGLDVAININAQKIICNDIITPIINMYEQFKNVNAIQVVTYIENNINKYNLNKNNKNGYLKLREEYNQNKNPLDLITLVAYCYNNQIRFNSKWEFNRAFGENRSEFNPSMRENLIRTINKIHNTNIKFINKSYLEIDFSELSSGDFVYSDPPYLITNPDYSIQASWDKEKEIKLLELLDEINKNHIKFALSNVLEHDGKSNNILIEWSKKYNINYLNHTYGNANADKRLKRGKSIEVLITNY